MARRIALTFEAGGDPAPTEKILAALSDAGTPATFFIDGRWAERNPDLLRTIAGAGHEVGSHGHDHDDWTTLEDEQIARDLEATEALVAKLAGLVPKPWARPPYGAFDERVCRVLDGAGYRVIYRHAVDGAHWPGETTTESVATRAREAADEDGVVTFHTNSWLTAGALPHLLETWRGEDAAVVRLSELSPAPSSRLQRHPDFEELDIEPGYVRPRVAGKWQQLNLLELGASAGRSAPAETLVARIGETDCTLVTGSGTEAAPVVSSATDEYVLVLAGEVHCRFGDDGSAGDLLARAGDLFVCPQGLSYQLGPTATRRRWLAAVLA